MQEKLFATITPILGAARANVIGPVQFDLVPFLEEADSQDIASILLAGFKQNEDGTFLMDCALSASEEAYSDAEKFMKKMTGLMDAGFDNVCWQVSLDPEIASSYLFRHGYMRYTRHPAPVATSRMGM